MFTTLFFTAAFAADLDAVPSETLTAETSTTEAMPAPVSTATHVDLPGYRGTNLAPDARPADSVFSATGGAVGANLLGVGAVGANARVSWAPISHLELTGETVLGAGENVVGYSSLTARSSIPLGKHWFVGPWFGGGTTWGAGSPVVLFGGGLAISGGGERVGFDASIPLAAFGVNEEGLVTDGALLAVLASEAHLSVEVAPRHTIRAGIDSFLPGVGYQYDNGHVFVGAQLHTLIQANVARAEVGFRM